MKAVTPDRFVFACFMALTAIFASQNSCYCQSNAAPFFVGFYYPTNGQIYFAPANVAMHASVADSNVVNTVQYFNGTNSLGIATNKNSVLLTNTSEAGNPFELTWSNVAAGSYTLTAVATDSAGNMARSAPVNITVKVLPPIPFVVGFYSPTNEEVVTNPTNLYVHASVTDSNVVRTMEYLVGSNVLAIVTNTGTTLFTNASNGNPFAYFWTNPPPATYTLTAIATDSTGATATSGPVNITVNPAPVVPFAARFYYPTNNQTFTAPTNIPLYVFVTDMNIVKTVQYFAGSNSLGIVTNKYGVSADSTNGEPFELLWSNAPPGSYTLTAVATDSTGASATSGPVNITVNPKSQPPPIPFVVGFYYPTNGQVFIDPTNVYIHASVTDSNVVRTMEYLAGSNVLAIATNTGTTIFTNTSTGNPFGYVWTNPPPGTYTLTAIATDSAGATATSGPITITIKAPLPVPFVVGWYYPTNGEVFDGPTNIGLHASVTDSNIVETVQYFSGSNSLGIVTNTSAVMLTNNTAGNPFFFVWTNVPLGSYTLTAVATDSAGATATSAPITISVIVPPPQPPTVTIYAPDPVAYVGTNGSPATNTATFLIRRDSGTNKPMTVYYNIGGTASNGVDYVTIPNNITIAPGQRYGLITIEPLSDPAVTNRYQTVILALSYPPNTTNTASAPYRIGSPAKAGAVIVDENILPITKPLVHTFSDASVHVSLPAPNGMNFCLQYSTNYVTWTSICTNTVLKGSAQFVDPDSTGIPGAMYRIVPVPGPAVY